MGENTAAEQCLCCIFLCTGLAARGVAGSFSNHAIDGDSTAVWQHLCFPCAVPTCFAFALQNYSWHAPADIFLEMEVSKLNGKHHITHVSDSWTVSAGAFQPRAVKDRITTVHWERNSHLLSWY